MVPRRRREQPRSARLQLVSAGSPERALSQVPRRVAPLLDQGTLGDSSVNFVGKKDNMCALKPSCLLLLIGLLTVLTPFLLGSPYLGPNILFLLPVSHPFLSKFSWFTFLVCL